MKRVAIPAPASCKHPFSQMLATSPLIFLLTSSGLPTVCHHFLTDSSFPSSRQSLVFVSYRPVLMCVFSVCAPA
ncbi:hypothetical protein [Escherichia coli]|uniref:hypothetical protein n=1 Tax=Escherichia coli TaxID=562 RepID=UPI0023082B1E|nr:hypothetical protein [Escherichia coli]WCE58906.1 hypothetical protein PL330_03790 [Escherichia coli]